MRYSDNLDFSRSVVTVYAGDVPMGSAQLDAESADDQDVTVTVPGGALVSAGSPLRVVFDLELPDLYCTPRQENTPWAYVDGSSTIQVAADSVPTNDLGLAPFPLVSLDGPKDWTITLSLPSQLSDTQANALGLAASRCLGSSAAGLAFVAADDVPQGGSVLALGDAQTNPLLKRCNAQLPLPFGEGGSFAGDGLVQGSRGYLASIGTLQLAQLDGAAVLCVAAPGEEGYQNLVQALEPATSAWSLDGSVCVAGSDGGLQAYGDESSEAERDQTAAQNVRAANGTSFAVTATCVAGVVAVGGGLAAVRSVRRRKEDKDA